MLQRPSSLTARFDTTLAENALWAEVTAALNSALAEKSVSNASTALRSYRDFCAAFNRWPKPDTGATDEDMCLYAGFMARTVATATIRNYISSGIRLLHKRMQWPWRDVTERYLVDATLKGIKRIKGERDGKKQKLPITLDILLRMRQHMNLSDINDFAMWTAMLFMFFTFLRKGNVTTDKLTSKHEKQPIKRADISLRDGRIWVTLRHTKTRQYGDTELCIPLPFIPGSELCPTTALLTYLAATTTVGGEHTHLFGQMHSGKWMNLTYRTFLHNLKLLLKKAGYTPEDYAGHSFRRGGATYAFTAGINTHVIAVIGDWASDAWKQYLNLDTLIRTTAVDQLSLAVKNHMQRPNG